MLDREMKKLDFRYVILNGYVFRGLIENLVIDYGVITFTFSEKRFVVNQASNDENFLVDIVVNSSELYESYYHPGKKKKCEKVLDMTINTKTLKQSLNVIRTNEGVIIYKEKKSDDLKIGRIQSLSHPLVSVCCGEIPIVREETKTAKIPPYSLPKIEVLPGDFITKINQLCKQKCKFVHFVRKSGELSIGGITATGIKEPKVVCGSISEKSESDAVDIKVCTENVKCFCKLNSIIPKGGFISIYCEQGFPIMIECKIGVFGYYRKSIMKTKDKTTIKLVDDSENSEDDNSSDNDSEEEEEEDSEETKTEED